MIRSISTVIFIFTFLSIEAQNWDSIREGRPSGPVEGLFFDSIHNELIVSSKFMDRIGGLKVRGVTRWNGIKRDSLKGGINTHDVQSNPSSPGGTLFCGIPYNGKLLVGGRFSSIGGINATCLALWDGFTWDSLPKRAIPFSSAPPAIYGFFRKGNLLYLYGSFTSIDGQPAKGLATWDGSNFTPIPTFTFNSFISIADMLEYQNELYVVGAYFYNPPAYSDNADVLKYDGTKWVSMIPGGFKGNFSGANTMAIYNNELYVGGHFLLADGNLGENIIKWNGSQWADVGFGGENVGSVKKLIVHNNKLWAIGCYGTAAHIPAFSISFYDGLKWCSLKDTIDNCLGPACIYKDTIFVGGGFWTAGGDSSITYLAKLKNENLVRSCNGVGVEELNLNNQISIYPNPVSNKLTISSETYFEKGTEVEIANALGQTILKLNYSNEIDVSSLPSGYYTLKIRSSDGRQLHSKFIKE